MSTNKPSSLSSLNETYFAAYRPYQPGEMRPGLPNGLTVRPAEAKDAEGLAILHQERDGGPLSKHRERYEKELHDDPGWQHRLLLVAEVGVEPVGLGRVVYFQIPPDPPLRIAPSGWYLAGVIVTPAFRRRGIGAELTRRRLEWIAARADEVFCFVNAQNQSSIALHTRFKFEEVTRDFVYPDATFMGGAGILLRAALSAQQTFSSDDPAGCRLKNEDERNSAGEEASRIQPLVDLTW